MPSHTTATPPQSPSAESASSASTPASQRSGLHALWSLKSYLRPYIGRMVTIWFATLLGVGASLVIPLVTREIIDGPIAEHKLDLLWPLGLAAIGLGAVEAFLIFTRRWVQARPVAGLETAVRNDLYARLQQLPMSFHGQWQSGQLLSRATIDLSVIRRFLGFGALFLVMNTLQLMVVSALLINMYWPLGLVVLATAFPVIILSMQFEKNYVKISRQVQDQHGELTTAVEEAAVGIRSIKAFGRRHHVYEQFDEQARELHDGWMEKIRLSSRFWSILALIPNLTMAVVLLVGGLAVGSGSLTLGTLVAFTTLLLQLIWPIRTLGHILAMAHEAMTAADRIREVLDTEPDIVGGPEVVARPRGHLRFEGAGFRFHDATENVLHDVWLDVHPGETVAIVGATGAGKTTLVGLVPRLHDVTEGRITLDGYDIRDLRLDNLRQLVATAFEEPTLFSMSARENLTLGRADATDEEIDEALEIAQATFVYDLPWGLDTRIGEQGMSLSGGQRQRLALARAVLAGPRVLVLDDTLSALDVETEALVEEALRRVLSTTTGLVVAHRASTVLLADRVALLDGGTITHVGTHQELLENVPTYRELLAQDAEVEAEQEVLS